MFIASHCYTSSQPSLNWSTYLEQSPLVSSHICSRHSILWVRDWRHVFVAMWVAHYPVVSHWVLVEKPCSRNLVDNVRGACDFVGGLGRGSRTNGTFARRGGNFGLPLKMAALGRNGVSSSSNVMLYRNSRIACPQDYIILVPVTARCSHISGSFPLCELDLRFRLQQGGNCVHSSHRAVRQLRRLNASLGSLDDGADAAGVSDDGKEQEVPANSLEFTHKVALDVLAPPDLVWKLWTDIKSAPQWMRWIDRVDFLDVADSPQDLPPGLSRLSRWICSTIGFEVMWVARVEHVESNLPVRVLRWATVEGLSSRGEVTFKENNTKGTTVELSISHSLPAALGRVMQSSALRGLVQATLQTDLECFQKYAAEAVNTEEDGVTERKGSLTITTDCSQNLCDSL